MSITPEHAYELRKNGSPTWHSRDWPYLPDSAAIAACINCGFEYISMNAELIEARCWSCGGKVQRYALPSAPTDARGESG